ncbi:MAG: hypothetical protein SGPRY_003018 [Prymnesium sp.]
MPRAVELHAALLSSPHLSHLNKVGTVCGFDLSLFNRFCHRSRVLRLGGIGYRLLTSPRVIKRFCIDSQSQLEEAGEAAIEMRVVEVGVAHAVVVWHTLVLTDDHRISTSPQEKYAKQALRATPFIPTPDVVYFLSPHEKGMEEGLALREGEEVQLIMNWRQRTVEFELRSVQARRSSEYHFPMLNDAGRSSAFAAAISRAVFCSEPRLVLDIGCGSGLLAMLAARAGAERVLALEMSAQVASVADEIVRAHGMEGRIRVLPKHSTQLQLATAPPPLQAQAEETTSAGGRALRALPKTTAGMRWAAEVGYDAPRWDQRADMLVFEILGTDPLAEGALILPCQVDVYAALVDSPEIFSLNSISSPSGLRMEALNSLSQRTRPIRLCEWEHTFLTEPRVVLRLRLADERLPPQEGEGEVEVVVRGSGTAHAVVAWFVVHLDGETSLSTGPGCGEPMRGYSWGQLCQFLPAETKVMCGHRMRFGTKWSDKGLRFDFKQLISHLSLAQERAAMGNSKNPAKFDSFEAGAW